MIPTQTISLPKGTLRRPVYRILLYENRKVSASDKRHLWYPLPIILWIRREDIITIEQGKEKERDEVMARIMEEIISKLRQEGYVSDRYRALTTSSLEIGFFSLFNGWLDL